MAGVKRRKGTESAKKIENGSEISDEKANAGKGMKAGAMKRERMSVDGVVS